MSGPGWREQVIAYIRAEALPRDKYGHQPRLYALACRIGQGMEYDDDILFAAAWMHDLGECFWDIVQKEPRRSWRAGITCPTRLRGAGSG